MIDVLLLGREHNPGRVRQAVEEALQLGCSDVGGGALSAGRREPGAATRSWTSGAWSAESLGPATAESRRL